MKNDFDKLDQPIPNRIALADGFFDQPFVSQYHPGSAVTASLEPTFDVNTNSGLASSTRRIANYIWNGQLPDDDPEKLAKILFSCENPPGSEEITGSIDAIGIVYPGLAKPSYNGAYWPESIDHVSDEATLKFVESLVYLVPIGPRPEGYSPIEDANLSQERVKNLANASENCWNAILERNAKAFGEAVTASFRAIVALFPHTSNPKIEQIIEQYSDRALGWKVSGAGGGGYLLLVSEQPIEEGIRIVIRRS